MPTASNTAQVSEAAKPHSLLQQNGTTAPERVPAHDGGVSDALCTVAHKALCCLAFALQEASKETKREGERPCF